MKKDEVYKITSKNDGDTEVSRSYVWMNIRVKDDGVIHYFVIFSSLYFHLILIFSN